MNLEGKIRMGAVLETVMTVLSCSFEGLITRIDFAPICFAGSRSIFENLNVDMILRLLPAGFARHPQSGARLHTPIDIGGHRFPFHEASDQV